MGLSFPILQRAVHDDARTVSRKVGFLQAANIAGCLLGSLLVGLFLLSTLGTTGTLRLLLVLGMGFAVLGVREAGYRSRFGVLLVTLGLLAALVPSPRALWQRLHGLRDTATVGFFEEDATGLAALTPWSGPKGGEPVWRVYVNGKSNSVLPFGGVHTALGAVPGLDAPLPRRHRHRRPGLGRHRLGRGLPSRRHPGGRGLRDHRPPETPAPGPRPDSPMRPPSWAPFSRIPASVTWWPTGATRSTAGTSSTT